MIRNTLSILTMAVATLVAGNVMAQGSAITFSKTRAQVIAELEEAQRTGDIVALGSNSNGQKLNELYPNSYPKK